MQHNPGFLKLVDAARVRIKECTVAQAKTMLDRGEVLHFLEMCVKITNLRRIMLKMPVIVEKGLSNAMWRRVFLIKKRRFCCTAEAATGRS